ncbi:MAG: sugar phosphate isomerase/epimerase [Armatimonadetes bacterium]|nr:sugar phosphate isomerase/epimerase [Armatimonadota bacterium]
MELGLHCWVYCQLAMRETGELESACRQVVAELAPLMQEVAAAGFESIETMSNLLVGEGDGAAHQAALASSGLRFLGFSHGGPYWDPAQRDALLDHLEAACAVAAPLGGRHIGVSATPPPGRAKTGADYDAQAETLRCLNALARKYELAVNLHTYERDAQDDFREVRELTSRLGQDELELGPDLAWLSKGGGDVLDFIARFGARMTFCHVRDRAASGEWAEGAGEGIEDLSAWGAALRRVGYRGPVVFEPAFPNHAPTRPLAETLRRSAACLRQAF